MEYKDLTESMINGLKENEHVESLVAFMADRSIQVRTTDGEIFNIGIKRTQEKIKRPPIFQRDVK